MKDDFFLTYYNGDKFWNADCQKGQRQAHIIFLCEKDKNVAQLLSLLIIWSDFNWICYFRKRNSSWKQIMVVITGLN